MKGETIMLKEKFTNVKQKTGGVIGKSCKFVHEHRRTIGYLTVLVVVDAICNHYINSKNNKVLRKVYCDGLNKGYNIGVDDTIYAHVLLEENGLLEQTMDGKKLDYDNDADVTEYIRRMKEIQQETLGYTIIEFSVKKRISKKDYLSFFILSVKKSCVLMKRSDLYAEMVCKQNDYENVRYKYKRISKSNGSN